MVLARSSWHHGCPGLLRRFTASTMVTVALLAAEAVATDGKDPWATKIVSYESGVGAAVGYDDPSRALGEPTRMIVDPLWGSSVVTPMNSPYLPTELVSIGDGGSLVVEFNPPIVDDPRHPFGLDLIVFGNAFFVDAFYPAGVPSFIYAEPGVIELSADGVQFVPVAGAEADSMFPTMGYADVGPYAVVPGSSPTRFTRPVDPQFGPMMFGAEYEELLAMYDGSGGGTGVDIASAGLSSARFVRIRVPLGAGLSCEIDAFARVSPCASPADFDCDGVVGGVELAMILAAWGTKDPAVDLDGDGVIGGGDLTIVLAAWTGAGG
ncbi:MAG: hypothetical protein FJ257_11265 [Phycisphaerae bacterium]|nr:hypothetical protein [Phycisphaerae bacterium]